MALAAPILTMARVIYAHQLVAAPANAGPGAPVTAQRSRRRAPAKGTRALPKAGGAAVPLVTSVQVPEIVRTILPVSVGQLAAELVRCGRPASATMLSGFAGDSNIVAERTVFVPGWMIRWDEVAVSQNVLMRKYANHHAYKGLVATWTGIFGAAMAAGHIPKATGRRRLAITRYVRSSRYLLDRGNLAGGFKPYLDSAVKVGLIRDDREADVDDHYQQAIDPIERVEITLCDL